MWSIAFKTLVADRGKLLTALVGVVFSIVLVNVQGGLFVGLIRKASLLVAQGRADIWVGHRQMHNVDFAQDIPRRWAQRIESVGGVRKVEPYTIGFTNMTLPSGGFENVAVIGCERNSELGDARTLVEALPGRLARADGVVIDESEMTKLEHPQIGDVREIGGRKARIVGLTRGVSGFLVTPYVFTTLERADRYLERPGGRCSYFLVQVEPNVDVASVCEAISRRVPELDALPSSVYGWLSIQFWMTRTGLGISFGAATLLGLFVGLVMVAQTLYASVLDRLSEFGTLKAIGAREPQLFRILMLQALLLAGIGAVFGLAIAAVIQHLFSVPQAPIVIPGWLSAASCGMVLCICLIASFLPYLRVRKIDPLMVLQS